MRIQQGNPSRLASVALGVILGAWLITPSLAPVTHAADHGYSPAYAAIGLWQDTTLLVHLVKLIAVGTDSSSCSASVQFFDEEGNSLGITSRLSVRPRQITSAELMFPAGAAGRLHVQPVITFLSSVESCAGVISSAEIVDALGATQVFVNAVELKGFNPQPEPPGVLGQ